MAGRCGVLGNSQTSLDTRGSLSTYRQAFPVRPSGFATSSKRAREISTPGTTNMTNKRFLSSSVDQMRAMVIVAKRVVRVRMDTWDSRPLVRGVWGSTNDDIAWEVGRLRAQADVPVEEKTHRQAFHVKPLPSLAAASSSLALEIVSGVSMSARRS